jgi:ABC-2 type transport system permease protein
VDADTSRPPWEMMVPDTLVICGRHLRHLRRAPGRFLGVTLNPLVFLFVMGFLFKQSIVVRGGGDYIEFLMAGTAAQVGLVSIGPTAIGVALDLREGLVDRFRSLPVAKASVLLGRTLADLLVSTAALAIVTGVSVLLGWRTHTDPGSVLAGFLLLIFFLYVMIWCGVLLGLSLRQPETIDVVGALVGIFFSFLSNAFLAVQGLPTWIQPIAEWNPLSAVVSACRQLFGNQAPVSDSLAGRYPIPAAIIVLTGTLLVVVPLASRSFRAAVH